MKYGKKKGIPASAYAQVQEFGRVDRKMNATPGSNTYEIHLDFNSYVSIFIRAMKCNDAAERKKQLIAHHIVMAYTLCPNECYHTFTKNYFE